MKRIYKIILALVIIFGFTTFTFNLKANDGSLPNDEIQEEEEKSWLADLWDEEWKPKVVTAISAFIGAGGATGVLYWVFKGVKKKFNEAVASLGLSKEQTELIKKANELVLNKVEALVLERLEPLTNKVDDLAGQVKGLLEENKSLKDFIKDSLAQTNVDVERVIKILNIAFTNDKSLVTRGIASEIKKV